MISQIESPSATNIIYPESDGQPMADNTRQFRWIMILYYNLEWLFAGEPMVFVAGDLLWYPVEGNNTIRQAPDVMVVFGVPKGDRGSYMQWREGNIAPQVVFEILSPGNTQTEMNKKQRFYNQYGVVEYYLYDPERNDLSGWLRSEAGLEIIEQVHNWVSPRLGIRFDMSGEELQIYRPNGERFASYVEIQQQLEEQRQRATDAEQQAEQERQRATDAEQRATDAEQRAEQERQRATDAEQRATDAEQRAERLAEMLRAAGIEPQ